ncbi:hypothetical protein EJ05DRAFT_508035 [Pseudovirgaria hyperparasitica]|uniref:Prokaryotic-type class I peptide chain release factors domain-containing protein n=1 Tax=Pseudovirgaria hyperparasitica TaxID=470096 RepID=A0A6A6WD86_9PEZI|nr:uncharacterized protein EJ05DRAFT_508035 [Pseudovirgaria hyperparasitica]KAF2760788.1 hypothetical protein EJ05DRAFT_508035 [Pseudovirgaria hyperparasitica]
MLRVRSSIAKWSCNRRILGVAQLRYASSRPTSDEEENIGAARKWLDQFNPDTIPKNICEVTFSRASGPGGQNVNKTNSKATLRVPLDTLLPRIPLLLHPAIRASRFYAAKSDSLVLQADDSRKQSDNSHACFTKLNQLITEVGQPAVPGETSAEQRRRMKSLEEAQNSSRLKTKKLHSLKKSSRRGSHSDF